MQMNPGMEDFRFHTHTIEDPMANDRADDVLVVTSRRALCRVAYVAAETASRFEREKIKHDPVAWMLAPRRLFGGKAALDACLERDAFLRAALLHGLSLGLDADPEQLDDLIDEEDEQDHDGSASRVDAAAQEPSSASVEVRA